jgi:hypothetical protein
METYQGVAYGNDRFMTVGEANVGTIAGTITGAGWVGQTSGATQNLRAVCVAQ